jgi:TolB-like protein/AraC-like DNA-binding protein/Tfp pilus assembly protein PilF
MPKEFIQKLTSLVEANLANEKFGPDELAREAGISHSHLNRKLKTISNQTISQFIREVRLKKAKELLLNEDSTVAEISYRVGFGSPNYFNKCFHEYFGYSPSELRNRNHENQPEEQPVETFTGKAKRTKIMIGLLVGLIVLIPIVVFLINKRSVSKAASAKEKSIAVLPFVFLGDEIDKQYLAIGMMDDILNNLSKIKDLRVISRTSVEQYRNTRKTANTIGREQDVDYLLEGSLQKDNNQVRLIVQLIKTKNEDHVWSNKYDYDSKDVFSIQSEVAETIASELQAAITPEEIQLIRKIPTTNLTAYDFYQRGKDELDNNGDSVSLEKAQRLFKKALDLDSSFALAYTGLARVYYHLNYNKNFLSKSYMDSVLILASKALVFDIQCAEAYYFRGIVYYQKTKIEDALKETKKSIMFNPNDWMAYYLRYKISDDLQDFVGAISNLNEAILRNRGSMLPKLLNEFGSKLIDFGHIGLGKKYIQQALELDGDSTSYFSRLAWAEFCEGNFENAYQIEKSAYKIAYKRDSTIVNNLLIYCTMTGRYEEGGKIVEKHVEHLKKSGEIDLYSSKGIGLYLSRNGITKEAEFYFNQQIKICEESIKLGRWNAIQRGAYFDLAEVYAFLGDKKKAYYYLEEVNKNHSYPLWWVTLFKHEPLLSPIRQEPRFQEILKDVEAKYQAEHERAGKWLAEHVKQ